MAKRFTDTELWDKQWFMELSPKLKCLVKMVRDKCDLSGVWSPNWIIASTYIGEKVTEEELLSINNGTQFEKNESGKIICLDFIRFQYGRLSDKSPVHRKILSILDSHKIEYKHPINRVQEEEEDKEEVKVVVKEEVKDKELEVESLLNHPFEDFWDLYDKKVGDKNKLEKKWNKLTDEERQMAMDYIPYYRHAQPDKTYRKNPDTFINNKSWQDEIITKQNGQSKPTANDFTEEWRKQTNTASFD